MDSAPRIKSQALEANLAESRVEVVIDPRYRVLGEVMSRYYGLAESVNGFLRELSHPYRNWKVVLAEARRYALDYVHVLRAHPRGPEAAGMLGEVFLQAAAEAKSPEVRAAAADDLLRYLQTLAREAGMRAPSFRRLLVSFCERIFALPEPRFDLFVRSYYGLPRLVSLLAAQAEEGERDWGPVNALLVRCLRRTYDTWLAESDPAEVFRREAAEFGGSEAAEALFAEVSHGRIRAWRERLEEIARGPDPDSPVATRRLLELPAFAHFVEAYRRIPRRLREAEGHPSRGRHLELICLFQIMNLSGLALLHEEILREINQAVTWIIVNDHYRNIQQLLRKTISILQARSGAFPETALDCLLNLGLGVYRTDDLDLLNFFIDALIDFGFQPPAVQGVDEEWRIQANGAHLQNIRTWLELIKKNPKRSSRLLSALVIHLALEGVFIRDVDLFPRDVTALLNSPIEPVYHLVKQLVRLLPVFFNDIGAEGRLRDVSTRIDELAQRRDPLVHFLRKQSHVESSSRIIAFVEAVFRFWKDLDREELAAFVPPSIFRQIDSQGPYVKGMHRLVLRLAKKGVRIPDDLLLRAPEEIEALLGFVPGVSDLDRSRFALAVELYRLLHQKYHRDIVDLEACLAPLRAAGIPGLEELQEALAEPDRFRRLERLLDVAGSLKEIVLSEVRYPVREDIYQKRHITIDIPSMYGSYHEMKFDCLGLALRLEARVQAEFEDLVGEIDLGLITKATFGRILEVLRLFDRALRLDGIRSVEFERQLEFLADSLAVRGFTLTQYLDIFKGFSLAVQNIVKDYFNNLHGANLQRILPQVADRVLPKYLPREPLEDPERLRHRITEIFFRDRIAETPGLQSLDRFLGRILQTLYRQSERLPRDRLHQLLLYDPRHGVVAIDDPPESAAGVIHLGTKGFNLVRLHRLGFRVPPGFIITTEVFRCREVIESYEPARRNFHDQVLAHLRRLEEKTGLRFGDPRWPLLLSVRSGASISQPGMMDTLLNVGNNEAVTRGLAERTGNPWFAWDCYRRFLQSYGMAHDLERDAFDALIDEYKRRRGVPLKRLFSGEQMREVALAYRRLIEDAGIAVIDDPLAQLLLAVRRVLDSWESPKARTYRRIMGISDDWGTAIAVQAMVFGNRSPESGTGVIFTHNPRWAGDVLKLWGDFTTANQGEDVVSGLVRTMPVSIFQQEIEMRDTDITLETHFPAIYRELRRWAQVLIEEQGWSPQEIEFTFEGPAAEDLYMLQTRDMAIRESPRVLRFAFEAPPQELLLGHGIGVSGGALSGRLVFSLEEIEFWRAREPATKLILARTDTVPDDIREIHAADGLLTARGGLTSHAAIVAHRLGKTCVVGCEELTCEEREKRCRFPSAVLGSGDPLSIDGQEGSVYRGFLAVKEA